MIVLDNGGLVALERNNRAMWARLKAAATSGVAVLVPAGVVAQAWRGDVGRQAPLARAVRQFEIVALDESVARAAGVLCGVAEVADVIDASVALAAAQAEVTAVCTSDTEDITHLLRVLEADTKVVGC